jgi:hypothetical protein
MVNCLTRVFFVASIALFGCGSVTARQQDGARGRPGPADGGGPPATGDGPPASGGYVLVEGAIISVGGFGSSGVVTVQDDSFEFDDEVCNADGTLCLRGGMTP